MSIAHVPTRQVPTAPTPAVRRQSAWKHGIAAAVVASAATTFLAVIAAVAGVSLPETPAKASRSLASRS